MAVLGNFTTHRREANPGGEATGVGGNGGVRISPQFHQDLFCNSYKYDKEIVGGMQY